MRSSLLALVAVLAVALAGVSTASAGSVAASGQCVPKTSKVNGHTAATMCGPATATVTVGGKTYSFSGGTCTTSPANNNQLQLSVGTAVLEEKPKVPNEGKAYFNMSIPKPATISTMFAYSGGKIVAPVSIVKVAGKIPASGTFSGKATGSSAKFTGTWNCHGSVVKVTGG